MPISVILRLSSEKVHFYHGPSKVGNILARFHSRSCRWFGATGGHTMFFYCSSTTSAANPELREDPVDLVGLVISRYITVSNRSTGGPGNIHYI